MNYLVKEKKKKKEITLLSFVCNVSVQKQFNVFGGRQHTVGH